ALSGRREDLGLRLGARVEAAESIGNPDPVDDAQDVIRYAIVELVMAPRAVAEPAAGVLVIHAYPERERGLHPVLGAAVDRESRVLRMVQLRGDQAASPEDARRESATELGGIGLLGAAERDARPAQVERGGADTERRGEVEDPADVEADPAAAEVFDALADKLRVDPERNPRRQRACHREDVGCLALLKRSEGIVQL